MAGKTLYDKLWDSHVVRAEEDGTTLLYIDRHLVHEVTSPQAFEGLRMAGRQPWRGGRGRPQRLQRRGLPQPLPPRGEAGSGDRRCSHRGGWWGYRHRRRSDL